MPRTKGHLYYDDLLELHLEGTLAAAQREELFEHLEHCDQCRRTLEAEQRLSERLKAVPKLVAPSSLRASIIQQASRERQERATPIVEDPRISAVLSSNHSGESVTPEDLPVFAGITRPRRSRARVAWRQASPFVAYTFLVFAAGGAVYTGTLNGIPGADQLQAAMRTGARSIAALLENSEGIEGSLDAQVSSTNITRVPGTVFQDEDELLPSAESSGAPGLAALPDSRVLEFWQQIGNHAQVARATLAALASAAERPVPVPAEQSGAQIAALVLRTTDPATRMSFERDPIGEAIQQAGILRGDDQAAPTAGADQFAYEGHRYRTYVVRVAENRMQEMLRCLERYRVPQDEEIVRALADQNRIQPRSRDQLAFFASRCEDFCQALQGCDESKEQSSLASASLRSLKIVLVE